MSATVENLFVGSLAPLGPRQVASGIDKKPVQGYQRITKVGLANDQQGDTRHHGGPEKALHHYPADHYAAWASEGIVADVPGFGENITSSGLREENICIGDVFRLGTALLQISQGRQPCWRLNAHFERSDMAFRVQKTGRTGWYYRVLEEGVAQAGDTLILQERPQPDWVLARIIDLFYTRTLDFEALEKLSQLPELALSWRELAARRIASRKVEDWSTRLQDAAIAPYR
ncbi:MOSC domain-containing protein [Aquamicrobium segne]|uniref:MOSC domain-containing protein n=1 Tax=Aquamicrobium segne TaxID=469547 RepID=A0ABW0GWY8_9HYPH